VSGPGVVGYTRDGRRLYRALDGESTQFYSAGGRGFVTVNRIGSSQTFAFDPRTGKTGRPVAASMWSLLRDDPPL
jgi:hypothetical protein